MKKIQTNKENQFMSEVKDLVCPICGEPTNVYMGKARKDRLCKKHGKMRNDGLIDVNADSLFFEVATGTVLNPPRVEKKPVSATRENKNNEDDLTCIICGEPSNGKDVCKKCYSEIMSTQKDVDKNKKPWELKDYYYNLKAFISRLKNHEEVTKNIYKLYAIAWLTKSLHNDEQLSDVVYSDTKHLVKIRDRLKEIKFDEQHKQNDKTIIAVADIEKNRATDGHICKSEGEVIIDDILYRGQVCHAYERRVKEIPQSERTVLADWFVPLNGFEGIYIEYWGMDTTDYQDNKEEKLKLYEKYHNEVRLIQINKNDIKDRQNLEDMIFQELKNLGWKK